ncbi:DUF3137 domain-containing protein [Nocardia stercoris]|uniref:DUF3137 domain-containing protein n=1 Tax=Nocardia stercoris TaxID=2483361 RepID=A0A3M2LFG6_9NOCA|nr:DUF3137 domain-containing protein [Nocardia stercoris]
MLLLTTPMQAFVPTGIVMLAFRKRWTARWAAVHGFAYQRKTGWPVPDWNFPPFSNRSACRFRVRDGMRGSVGGFAASFFHVTWLANYKVSVGPRSRNVFVLRLPRALPRLSVGVSFDSGKGDSVQFESAHFNDRFFVYCADPVFAHAVFTPRTVERLVELKWSGGATTKFEIVGDLLVAISTAGNLPNQIGDIFEIMRIIADGVPRFVWNDYGTTVPQGNRGMQERIGA